MKNRYIGIDPFITTVINNEVPRLAGRYGIELEDIKDIQQDLHTQVWRKLSGRFTPDHPRYRAAVRQIVDSRIKDEIERRKAKKRWNEAGIVSLDQPVESPEHDEDSLADLKDIERLCEQYGSVSPAWHRRRENKMDLESAMERLPSDLRLLAETIDALNGNMASVERELGITRKKLRWQLGKLQELLCELLEINEAGAKTKWLSAWER